MSKGLVERSSLEAIANAIREKNGNSDTYTPAQMGPAISAITAGDNIDHEDLPAYVKTEALDVARRVKAKMQSNSIVILAGSDSHQIETDDTNGANTMAGNLHAGMGMKALTYILPFDFAAYLGDYTAGSNTTSINEGLGHFASINSYIDEAFRGLPQFRTVGNHDPLSYSYDQNGRVLSQAELYNLIGKYNDDGITVMGSTVAGYCYRDFTNKNFRVICLNTADIDKTSQGGTEAVSDTQKKWFADTLISTPQDYGIIILSHHPLDWGNIMATSHILRAYVEEQSNFNIGGTIYDFTNKNKSSWILQLHGHVHTFTVDNLHWNNGGTGVAYNVKRIALPCTNFYRTNEYGRNSGEEYYGIEFGTPGDTQSKVANTAKDTAFCVFVINPSEQKIYAINYGAGYDRDVYWGENAVSVTGVSLDKNSCTITAGQTEQLTATITPADATNTNLNWSSSNTSVATVSGGLVTGVAVGNAVITVTTQDGNFTATCNISVEAVKIEPTNLVPISTNTDGTIFNNIGYMNDKYVSGSNNGNATGYVATGFIHVDNADQIDYIYIRGADIDDSDYSRFYIFNETSWTTSWGYKGINNWAGWISSVEKLGTEYYRITTDKSFATSYMATAPRSIRLSLKGSGEHLFISFNNPIIDEYYPWGNTTTYTVTNNLTNITSNGATSVNEGASYSATLTPTSGYTIDTVTITMNGIDITSTAYNNHSIIISNVTGNIIITASASQASLSGNLINIIGYQDDTRVGTGDGSFKSATGYVALEIPIDTYFTAWPSTLRIKGADFRSSTHSNASNVTMTPSGFNSSTYNGGPDTFAFCGGLANANWTGTFDSSGNITITCTQRPNINVSSIRLCGYGSGANMDIRINEDFDD